MIKSQHRFLSKLKLNKFSKLQKVYQLNGMMRFIRHGLIIPVYGLNLGNSERPETFD